MDDAEAWYAGAALRALPGALGRGRVRRRPRGAGAGGPPPRARGAATSSSPPPGGAPAAALYVAAVEDILAEYSGDGSLLLDDSGSLDVIPAGYDAGCQGIARAAATTSLVLMEASLVGPLAMVAERVSILLMRSAMSGEITSMVVRELRRAHGVSLSPHLVRPLAASLVSLSTRPLHLPALARAAARRVIVAAIHSICSGAR